ncbi:MAG TPA: PIG-L deacetylase family protein [Acidobacteriaceae bacterium]|jgi:LmbE family N-acetylglucosaminyl deacetylase|nr:PIG-L deacetylase family protein [Acidobacteriaceae bacterium]
MHGLKFSFDTKRAPRILCLGAHSDDIEIGCGGTILRLLQDYPGSIFTWVVFSGSAQRAAEARRAAELFAGDAIAGGPRLLSFRDGFLPSMAAEVKEVFEDLKLVSPDLVFTHNRRDAHQDHRLLAELAWNTFRDHLILEYEIPKYDGDLGQPAVFVPLPPEIVQKKVDYLLQAFDSQREKRWFEAETFRSLMRLRGMECNASSGYAEAFYARKLVL